MRTWDIDPSSGDRSHTTIRKALDHVQQVYPGKEIVMKLSANNHIVDGPVVLLPG